MNQFIVLCFAIFCVQISSGQVTMQSNENSNYYSVNVPSAHISFHRNFNGNPQLSQQQFLNPEPLAQYVSSQSPPASQHVNLHAFNAFPASQAEPQKYYMERLQQTSAAQHQPQHGVLRFSPSSEVSSVRYTSDGLNYNF